MCDPIIGKTLMGGKMKLPDDTAGKPPTRDATEVKAAEDAQRRRVREAKGRSATVLTRTVQPTNVGETLGS